jgi:hypothetical protein
MLPSTDTPSFPVAVCWARELPEPIIMLRIKMPVHIARRMVDFIHLTPFIMRLVSMVSLKIQLKGFSAGLRELNVVLFGFFATIGVGAPPCDRGSAGCLL